MCRKWRGLLGSVMQIARRRKSVGQTRVSGVSRSQTVVRRRLLQIGLGFGALLVLSQTACSRTPEAVEEVVPLASVAPQPVAPTADDLPAPPDFFVPRAQFHLEALAALSPRSAGERNDLAARAYLERAFGGLGAVLADVSDREAPEARPEARTRDGSPASPSPSTDGRPAPRHLLARFPGRSPDVVLLVAPYPAVGEDDWIGDSSVALLIELARVLSLEPAGVHDRDRARRDTDDAAPGSGRADRTDRGPSPHRLGRGEPGARPCGGRPAGRRQGGSALRYGSTRGSEDRA